MNNHLVVIIAWDNKVYLPYDTTGRKPLYTIGTCNSIKRSTFLTSTSTAMGITIDDIKLPFDLNYMVGYVSLDNIDITQPTTLNYIFNLNKVTITKVVTSWGKDGDILNGKEMSMWLRDIDFEAIKREITIDGILK